MFIDSTKLFNGYYYYLPLKTLSRLFLDNRINFEESSLTIDEDNKYIRSLKPGVCLILTN